MNKLIGELSSTNIGCSIDGVCINNISYADDMVLLSPSIGALRKLLRICESYSEAHGLSYNAKKSEFMIFKAGNKSYSSVPPVAFCGIPLKRVQHFKYLGHWVSDDLCDNMDIERERRALSVRCNMLARRFARCTTPVKMTLFKAYCQSFYTCSLWTNFTQRAYSALRVQYNNAFRILNFDVKHIEILLLQHTIGKLLNSGKGNTKLLVLASYLCCAYVSCVCSEFPWLLTAATVQFLFNVYGCEAGDPFCGDIDGVPLGQRGVLPGPTQINCRAFCATRERSVPPLDPCCWEPTLRTPSAVPRTPTHSYLKFGSRNKLEHIIQLPKFV